MKRLLFIWALFLCSLSSVFAQYSGSGSGTENDPYLIFYAEQLNQVRNFLEKDVYFKLMSDIDLTDWISENAPKQGWQPIGVDNSSFWGVFDGNGHQISSVNIYRSDTNNVGLFGATHGATIKNLTVRGKIEGKERVGGICGYSTSSTFVSCKVISDIKGTSNIGGISGYDKGSNITSCDVTLKSITGQNVGGIIGYEYEKVKVSSCNIDLKVSGNDNLGGVIGYSISESTLADNKVQASISGKNNIGGILGYFLNDTKLVTSINKCAFYGNLSGYNNVGGIVGNYDNSCDFNYTIALEVANSYSICNIKANDYIGGIVGRYNSGYGIDFDINNSFFSGTINGNNGVGGIIGYINVSYSSKVRNNMSLGSLFGTNAVGGIVGLSDCQYSNRIKISSCVSGLSTISASHDNVGRIYGRDDKNGLSFGTLGTSEGNLGLSTMIVSKAGVVQDVLDDNQNGTSTGPSALKLKANYVAHGWDFNNDWTMQETETYPYKPWQAAPPQITSKLVSKETTISGKSIDGGTVYIEVGDIYKSSVACNGNSWSFSVPSLQSGYLVRVYAVSKGKNQSPYTDTYVGYPGSGTLSDPYRIYTAADLQGVYKKGYYKLMNDVDLTEWINKNSPTEGWPAIGKNGLTAVYFDGGGHTVSGLWCNTTAEYNGLFSNFPDGYIQNLNVKVAKGKEVKGGDCTGIVIGRFANGSIDHVTASGSINGSKRSGGVIGVAENLKISSSKFDGTLKSESENAILGGIAGEIKSGELTKSQAKTQVNASGNGIIAGALVGNNNGKINSCYAEGAVSLTGENSYASGLVGQNQASAVVENCYSVADASATLYAAGLVAYNYGKISNSYTRSNVKSVMYGAGAVGYNDGAKATINGLVAGNPKVDVTDKTGWSIRVLGGFKNEAKEPGENNYALNSMILSVNGVPKKVTDNILDGFAKTEAELNSKALYESLGWSFNNVWNISEGNGWPTLDMNVYGLVSDIEVTPKKGTLKVGQSMTLEAIVTPDDATNKSVVWTSSDNKVATVENGVVSGVGNGKATITATTTDGTNLSDFAVITVSAPVDDSIVLNDSTVMKNTTVQYPVYLNNADPICSFQFDIYLPEGMDVAKNEDGDYDFTFAGRQKSTHTMSSRKQKDGAIRVIAFSSSNAAFQGDKGALINIPLVVGDLKKGDYRISIKNIVLSDKAEKEYLCEDSYSTISVEEVLRGDANADGKVSLADVNSTVNYILGDPSPSFSFAAADINENNAINVSDVNSIVNILLDENKASAKPYRMLMTRSTSGPTTDRMFAGNIQMSPGETKQLTVFLDNTGDYCSFQFDLILPEGITVPYDEDNEMYMADMAPGRFTKTHSLGSNLVKPNRFRVIVYSIANKSIKGTSGAVVNITLKADDKLAIRDYTLKLENITLADAAENEYYPSDSESTVNVVTTGIKPILMDGSSDKIYDLQGRRVNTVKKGIYIVNGKKLIVSK